MNIRYFDNAATTKVKEEVVKEMFPYFFSFFSDICVRLNPIM